MTVIRYQHREEEFQHEEQRYTSHDIVANKGSTHRATLVDGTTTTEELHKGVSVGSAELNPYYGTDSIFATAQTLHGTPAREITADTLITVDGIQGKVSALEGAGLVHRTRDGSYAEGPDPNINAAEAPAARTEPELDMPQEHATAVDQALDRVADGHIFPLMASGIGLATGELDAKVVIHQMAQYTGLSPDEAAERLVTLMNVYQAQADTAITTRAGISKEDLPDFWRWAKASKPGALKSALQKQMYDRDFAGFRDLTNQYFADNPPSREAVERGGYQTRQTGELPEVFMDGRWMTIQAAARLGYF